MRVGLLRRLCQTNMNQPGHPQFHQGDGQTPAKCRPRSFALKADLNKPEEGAYYPARPPNTIKPSRPNSRKIAAAIAPILKSPPMERLKALDEIVHLAGEKPNDWKKPNYGDFEYWLAHNCGWISNAELKSDTAAYEAKKRLALETSHRFSSTRYTWIAESRYEEPVDRGDYTPQVNMKLINDRNLTDSSRRIAMFVMRHAYQDNRKGRFIGMTVSFIMKGLSLSRRTVQRSLTLLETLGYFRCEVTHSKETKMCIGLIIRLLSPLFPGHHKEKWPENRRTSGASSVPHKQIQKYIYQAKRVFRITWAIRCMNGVARKAFGSDPTFQHGQLAEVRGFKTIGNGTFLSPKVRTQTC